MKLLTPNSFVNALKQHQKVALVLCETLCKQQASTVEHAVSCWLKNMNTMEVDILPNEYRKFSKETSTCFIVGTTFYNVQSFTCFQGDTGLFYAIEQGSTTIGGIPHYTAALLVFAGKPEEV